MLQAWIWRTGCDRSRVVDFCGSTVEHTQCSSGSLQLPAPQSDVSIPASSYSVAARAERAFSFP